MKKCLLFVFMLVVLLVTPTLANDNKASSPLRVGVIVPLSGDFAHFGQAIVRAMELANDQQGGKALKLLVEDNRTCQSPEAISAYHKLVDIDGAEILVTFCTAAAQAVLGPAKARGIPVIQLTEPGPDPDGYMLKLMPESVPFVNYLAKALYAKYKKLALVANTMEVNTGTRGNVPLFKQAFESLGGKIVYSEDFPDSELDFRSLILRIKKSDADAVVPFIWPVQQMAAFLKQSDQLNLWKDVQLGGSFVFEFIYAQLVEIYPRIATLDGLDSVNFMHETSATFVEDYKERFKETPPQFADYAFDAATILKRCALDKLCQTSSMKGVSGEIQFAADGRRVGRFELRQLKQGKFVSVADANEASKRTG